MEEHARSRAGAARDCHRPSGDQGSAAVEFIGFLPVLLLVGLAAIQLGLAAFAAQQAGTGARAAARTATLDDARTTPETAARTAMTDWVARRADTVHAPPCTPGTAEVTATVDVSVPGLLPGTGFHVTRHATMRCPDDARAPTGGPAGPPSALPELPGVPPGPAAVFRNPSDDSREPHESHEPRVLP
ncbi:TadE family protein [Streptomyces sp. CA-181903]|uniref:TadE family protein n=1 Tax=Streptomyces sp. CA-181903 TaxID=3240055 RepID=UPI003D90F9E0